MFFTVFDKRFALYMAFLIFVLGFAEPILYVPLFMGMVAVGSKNSLRNKLTIQNL